MRFSLFCLLLACSITSKATNFYVDAATTSSTQNGSAANPWKTLAQVGSNWSLILPGDVISFKRGGTYPGQLTIGKSGTAGNPITFNAYGTGNAPMFTGTGSTITSLFYLYNRNYVTFRDLEITDPSISATDRSINSKIQRAFYIDGSSNNCKIINVKFSLVGVGVFLVGSINTVDSCNFTNLRMVVNDNDGGVDDYGANPLVISSNNNIITHNYINGAWALSYDFGYDGGAFEFFGNCSNNFIAYNTAIDCNGFLEVGSSGSAINSNNVIAYNLSINNDGMTYLQLSSTFATSVRKLQFYNNVFIETASTRGTSSAIIGHSSGVTPADSTLIMRNNIFQLSTGIDVLRSTSLWSSTSLIRSNNVYKLSNQSVTNFSLNGSEISTSLNIFRTTSGDPTTWDYYLAGSSPAINLGMSIASLTRDFAGNPVPSIPDAGILEVAGTITPPSTTPLSVSAIAGSISCAGGSTTVTVSASGGTSPYSGTGIFTVTGGTYAYNVTDANGVVATTNIVVTQPSILTLTLSAGTITVAGGTTTITSTATGGSGTRTFRLNNGSFQASGSFTGVAAGTHNVTVRDANGCTTTQSITIAQPTVLVATSTSGAITCNGGSATVTVTASGGIAPYSGTGTFSRVSGTYSFTVTDANGATSSTSITISQPLALTLSLSAGTISAFGGTTTITATAAGGTGTRTFSLNTGAFQTSNSFGGIAAGTYAVTVRDVNGCTLIQNITITQPAPGLAAVVSASGITCNGGSTTVTVAGSGGSSPYTGTGTFTVSAGVYTYTITDATGATATSTITVTQPALITVTVMTGTISNIGGTTSVDIAANGGTGNYSYQLNGGSYQTSNIFNNVSAGNHSVTVKDANGCTSVKTFVITQPAPPSPLSVEVNQGTILCNGGTAVIELIPNGGIPPYVGVGSFSVSAGTYTYTVSDASGASVFTTVIMEEPTQLDASLNAGIIGSNGGTTSITVSAIYGTGAYSYQMNNGAFQASNIFNGVTAGTYTITIRDNNGCTIVRSITINEPAPNNLSSSATATVITCNGAISTVTVNASGGVPPYIGTGYFTAYGGTFNYSVKDATGFTIFASLVIPEPARIDLSVSAGTIPRVGMRTTVSASASGGTGNVTYSLNGSPYQNNGNFQNVPAGTHVMRAMDANGCTTSRSFTINNPTNGNSLNLNIIKKTTPVCKGSSTGSIEVLSTGGRAPYTYAINNGRFTTSTQFLYLVAGTYSITTKDANGNTVTVATVVQDGRRTCDVTTVDGLTVNAYPNPTTDVFRVSVNDESDAEVMLEVMNLNGKRVHQAKGKPGNTYTFGANLQPGIYFIKVTQGDKVKTQKVIKL